jgi:hypothetical protein
VHWYARELEKLLAQVREKRQTVAMEARTASFAARKAVGVRGRRGLGGLCTKITLPSGWYLAFLRTAQRVPSEGVFVWVAA